MSRVPGDTMWANPTYVGLQDIFVAKYEASESLCESAVRGTTLVN
jgi:hypothetical protein